MQFEIDNGKIIFTDRNKEYTFNAHGEEPHPSIMPSVIVGGKHLSSRSSDEKIEKYTAFFDVPETYCDRYHSMFAKIGLEDYKDGKLYFKCDCSYTHAGLSVEEELREAHELGLPMSLHTFITSNTSADEIEIAAGRQEIIRKEEPFLKYFTQLDFPDVSMWTYQKR